MKNFLFTLLLFFDLTFDAFCVNYQFQTIAMRDGLSNNSVNAMFVDSHGFLWIGTEYGLNRYDGYEIKSYTRLDNKHAISNVEWIEEDAEGNLWLKGDFQYTRLVSSSQTFDSDILAYLHSVGIDVEGNFKLNLDQDGNIWVVSTNRICKYCFKEKNTREWKVSMQVTPTDKIRLDSSSGYLYIMRNSKMYRFSEKAGGKLQKLELPEEMTEHLRFYVGGDGTLWIFSMVNENICRYNVGSKVVKQMVKLPQHNKSKSNAIRALRDDGQGNMWIATDHSGVFVYDKITEQFTHILHQNGEAGSISSDNVTCLLFDRYGTMWMGHLKTGVSYCNERYHYFGSGGRSCSDISTMMFDHNGDLWIGSDGNGLYVEHKDGRVEKTSLPNITISSLLEDHNGTVWVGSYNEGLFRMNGTNSYTVLTEETGKLPHNSVWQMVEDNTGWIWYCSAFGPLVRFNPTTQKSEVYKTDTGNNVLGMSFAYDGGNTLYVGTSYGVYMCDVVTGKGLLKQGNKAGTSRFHNPMILSMCMDKYNNILWLGHMTGLTAWDLKTDSLYFIDSTNGLYDNNVKSIIGDSNGNVWVSTSSCLSCIRVRVGSGYVLDFNIRNFTANEGLQTGYFNKLSAARGPNGEILMGGNDGYTIITPQKIFPDAEKTIPEFAEIKVGDRYLDCHEEVLSLSHDDYQILIKFFTGNLLTAKHVQYAYRIKGLRDEWVYTRDNKISFFSLTPGNYELEVKARGDDGEWGDVRKLKICVSPPLYASTWMICVYVLLLLALGVLGWRMLRLRQQRKMEEHKRNLERDQAVQISEMKLGFFTNISHDLRTPLTLIISPLQSLLSETLPEKVRVRLEVIRRNAELLHNQVNTLLDFRRLDVGAESLHVQTADIVQFVSNVCLSFQDYAEERNIRFAFNPGVESLLVDFDGEKVGKIMYNLLSNAFKFTPDGGAVTVTLDTCEGKVMLTVADTGEGVCDEDKERIFQRFYQSRTDGEKAGSGLGLHIVKEYVTMHGGEVSVRDNRDSVDSRDANGNGHHGAVFTVVLPLSVSADVPDSVPNVVPIAQETGDKNRRYTVLVVDDNTDMCNFVADSLMDDYVVLKAANGEEALAVIADNDVNLVVSDVMMPKIDGMELCKRIKTSVQTSHIPVILLTAKTADSAIIEGLQHGADDYITKPFNVEHLKLRVQKFVEWANNNHEKFKKKVDIEPKEITITSIDEDFVKKVMDVVEAHMADEDFSVEMLGHEIGMSRTNMYKKLMNITGYSPIEFIRIMRMKRACKLLKAKMQISEVASSVGYSTSKRFTENFKAMYGMLPSEYVKLMAEQSGTIIKL